MKAKKGSVFSQIGAMGVGIATLALIIVVAFLIMAQAKTQIGTIENIDTSNISQCDDSIACNATETLQEAVADIPGWVPLIVIGVIGAVLLGIVALYRGR